MNSSAAAHQKPRYKSSGWKAVTALVDEFTEDCPLVRHASFASREKTRQRPYLILKPWKRGGLEDFSRTKEDEMTAATFDHQVGKSL
jgi:hypothetical protein